MSHEERKEKYHENQKLRTSQLSRSSVSVEMASHPKRK
jgi:hypothetical protein